MSRAWTALANALARLPPRGRERAGGRLQRPDQASASGRVEARRSASSRSIAASLASTSAAAVGQVVGRAAEPGGEPAVEGQPGLDLLEPARGRRPSPGRGRAGCRRPRGSRRPGVRGRRRRRPARGPTSASGSSAAGDPLEEPLGRAVGLVEQGVALGGGRAELPRRWPAGGPRGPARRARRAAGRRRPARRARTRAGPARAGGPRPRRSGRAAAGAASSWAARAVAIRRRAGSEPAVGVEQVALAVGVEQGPALVLAVDVDQPLAQRAGGWRPSRAAR